MAKNSPQGRLISQIAIVQKQALPIDLFLPPPMFDSRAKDIARSSYNAVYDVSLFQQELREVRAVLASNTGD